MVFYGFRATEQYFYNFGLSMYIVYKYCYFLLAWCNDAKAANYLHFLFRNQKLLLPLLMCGATKLSVT
jgi:hypothetical protein